MTTIAVMQPYFFPYTGYYQLMAAVDIFVLFDCVQFNRRGWVHRNKFTLANGERDWLTLPLKKMPQATKIQNLQFDQGERLEKYFEMLQRFPMITQNKDHPLIGQLKNLENPVASFLQNQLSETAQLLNLSTKIICSSTLSIPENLRAQERIIAICKTLNAKNYINAAGGRVLYEPEAFHQADLTLSFMKPYEKSTQSILERLLTEPVEHVRADILNLQKAA